MAIAKQTEIPPVQAKGKVGQAGVSKHADHTESGETERTLSTFPAGTHVARATAKVEGEAFSGRLKFLKGVKVTPSPVVYDASGRPVQPTATMQAFIVDFSGMISLLELEMLGGKAAIAVVLPWMGSEFSPRPAYPATGALAPKPDPTGTVAVGFASLDVNKLLIQLRHSGAALTQAQFLETCRITTATSPRGIKATINGRPPFWTREEALDTTVDITGLAEELNGRLQGTAAPTQVTLRLTSETPGVLSIQFDPNSDLDASRSASARWAGQSTLDVALNALEPTSVTLSFPATGTARWRISRLVLDLAGEFPIWRAFPAQSTDAPGKLAIRVDGQFSAARRVVLSQAGEVFGFSLLLHSAAASAQIRVEVANESDGQPDSTKALATADIALPAQPLIAPAWIDALFSAPVQLEGGKGLWVVVKAKTGAVEWAGIAESLSGPVVTLFNTEGGRWLRHPQVDGKPPVTQIRILRRPFATENMPLLNIAWVTPARTIQRSVDPHLVPEAEFISEGVTTVDLNLPAGEVLEVTPGNFGNVSVPVTLTASGSGRLTIRGAKAFYTERSA